MNRRSFIKLLGAIPIVGSLNHFTQGKDNKNCIRTVRYQTAPFLDWESERDKGNIYQIFDYEKGSTYLCVGSFLCSSVPQKDDIIFYKDYSQIDLFDVIKSIDRKTIYINSGRNIT